MRLYLKHYEIYEKHATENLLKHVTVSKTDTQNKLALLCFS